MWAWWEWTYRECNRGLVISITLLASVVHRRGAENCSWCVVWYLLVKRMLTILVSDLAHVYRLDDKQ
jgi:hypothetical protein